MSLEINQVRADQFAKQKTFTLYSRVRASQIPDDKPYIKIDRNSIIRLDKKETVSLTKVFD